MTSSKLPQFDADKMLAMSIGAPKAPPVESGKLADQKWNCDTRTFYTHGAAVSLVTRDGKTICEVLGEEDERRACAQFIASAPETKRQRDELLAACYAMLTGCRGCHGIGEECFADGSKRPCEHCSDARAAIANVERSAQ